jgi:hypothetical protein
MLLDLYKSLHGMFMYTSIIATLTNCSRLQYTVVCTLQQRDSKAVDIMLVKGIV